MKYLFFVLFLPLQLLAQPFAQTEIKSWEKQAASITIIRDNYGIPHVYGKTDADAVFGLLYAQCEDDFKRVELNYIEKLGRKAEVFGETKPARVCVEVARLPKDANVEIDAIAVV